MSWYQDTWNMYLFTIKLFLLQVNRNVDLVIKVDVSKRGDDVMSAVAEWSEILCVVSTSFSHQSPNIP